MADLRMPDINEVRIAGRLTFDPDLKYTAGGVAYCKFGIAQSRKYKTKDGGQQEETNFVNVTVWAGAAEWIGTNMKKGQSVYISGRLRSNEWVDNATGAKRTGIEIHADRVQSLEWQGDSFAGGGNQQAAKPKPRVIEEPMEQDDIPF